MQVEISDTLVSEIKRYHKENGISMSKGGMETTVNKWLKEHLYDLDHLHDIESSEEDLEISVSKMF